MKKLLLLSLVFLPFLCFSQVKYRPIFGSAADINAINEIVEKVKSGSAFKMLVYLPKVEDTEKVSSILVVQKGSKVFYWLIKDDSVLTKGQLESNKIFSYQYASLTGATKREDTLRFVPPLVNGIETESVIYEDRKVRFYFELGKNVAGYSPDPAVEKYRQEWLEIIREELNLLL
ncbi:hypothetical protein [Rufibacter roseus]|uniref:DUF4468 domain-containing protein n=1 Tax=Rufibacter roseus TaxID=1567108 RepID=A0ABW2DIN0_9BACT|nr:hypothetical protein [Rufibacter roseus]